MAQAVTMPQLGETVVEGTITKWLKHEGDSVERDEPLFEISTDKVDTEVPSPLAGKLVEIDTMVVSADGKTRTFASTGIDATGRVINNVAVFDR